MTITRLTPSHGVLAKIALPLLAGLLLVGCNNSDPYSDANIGGNVLQPSTVNPLDPNETAATQVALFVNKPVKGLAYECQDSGDHKDTVKYNSQTQQDDDSAVTTTVVPVARCGNDASSITFYLGSKESLNVKYNVELGKVYLPLKMPIGSDGNQRNYTANGETGVSDSTFTFNFSLADVPASPERLSLSGIFDSSGNCNSGKQAACKAVYEAALLMALDTANGQGNELVISPQANTIMTDWLDSGHSALDFDQASYADFSAKWASYVDAVMGSNTLPALNTVLNDVLQDMTAGASRLRAGTYSLDYSSLSQVTGYQGYYPNSVLMRQMGLATLKVDFMTYPDGRMAGFGTAVDLGSVCSSTSDLTAFVNCLLFGVQKKNFVSVYGVNSSRSALTDKLQLSNVSLQSLDSSGDHVAIDLFGRFFGDYLYDGRQPQSVDEPSTDFLLDYPSTGTATPSYVLKDSEKGSMTGQFFSIQLPGYKSDGSVGVTNDEPSPFPVRLDKTASIQLTPFNETTLSLLRGQYYRIQLLRLCDGASGSVCNVDANPDTNPNPPFNGQPDVEVGDSGNYPTSTCLRTQAGSTNCLLEVNSVDLGEMPRPNMLNGTAYNINLKFVDGVVPGSLVVELLNDQCQPVKDVQGNNLTVGYVSGTPDDTSADISLLFASPDMNSQNKVPQLGAQLAGRIDLSDVNWPIYRMGDDNFAAKLRARWIDSSSYRLSEYFNSLNPKPSNIDGLTDAQRKKAFAISSGAVSGQKLGVPTISNCTTL